MKLRAIAFCLLLACSAPRMMPGEPGSTARSPEFDKEAKEVAGMEKELARAIDKKDTPALEKLLAPEYFDVYEGDKRGLSRLQSIARCKAGLLRYLAIEKESEVHPQDNLIAVEGMAKLIPNQPDDTVPKEQWVHVRRLWQKADGRWILRAQIRRLEGDDGKGEDD